jgi:quercetin dioxygenase-like cupin family protein
MSGIDVDRVNVVDVSLDGEELVTLEALADAVSRLDPRHVQHHLADIPVVLPEGRTTMLPLQPVDVVRGLQTNGCWVMVRALATLPEYEALLNRITRGFELALRARGEQPTAHDLIAFLGAPGATVPVHYDRNHHLLVQVEGTKTVGTGTFRDPDVHQRQLERGMLEYRLNADAVPDDAETHVLHRGQALVIPAFTFHWVTVGPDVSIALTCAVATGATEREVAVHSFNERARRIGIRPTGPGNERNDRWKQQVLERADRARKLARRG